MITKQITSRILTAISLTLIATSAFAGGGTPIDEAGQNAVDIGTGLGALACAGGVMGACAGGMMRSTGILAGGATVAVCGGAWAGAPQVVEKVIGTAAGFGLTDLLLNPATLKVALIISGLN